MSGMPRGRILHLIDTGGPGGAETVFLELAVGMAQRGWTPTPVIPEVDWLDGALKKTGLNPILLANQGSFDWPYIRSLRRLLRSQQVDIVHAHLLGSGLYGTLACLGTQTPLVCTLHGRPDIPPTARFRALKTRVLRRASNRVVCVSASLRDHFVSTGDVDARARVIENGIRADRFHGTETAGLRDELRLGSETLLFGAVGNVRPSKDYANMLRAFARVDAGNSAPHLVIAGHYGRDWEAFRALERLAATLQVDERVHFLGFREDIPRFLNDLDVFVLSSSDEGFSLVTVQAMAAGRACALTLSGGPENIVGPSGAALLVPPGKPQALAAAMNRLGTDPELRKVLGEKARDHARRHYSIDRMLDRYEALYEELLF